MSIKLLDKNDSSKLLVFHIQKNVLHYFFGSNRNKAFFLYIILLELSNNNGFCFLKIKEILENQTLNITNRHTIYSYFKELNNNNLINAIYISAKHQWQIQINTMRHIRLFREFKEKTNSSISFDKVEEITDDFIKTLIDENESYETSNNEITNNIINDNLTSEEPLETKTDSVITAFINKEISKKLDKNQESEQSSDNLNQIGGLNEEKSQESNSNETQEKENNEMKPITLEEKERMDRENLPKIISRLFGELQILKPNDRVLLYSPYKTTKINENDVDTDIFYSIDVLEKYANFIQDYIQEHNKKKKKNLTIISPICDAFKNAKAEIKEKNANTDKEIYLIKQKHLDKINFNDENLIKQANVISLSFMNYLNVSEMETIEKISKEYSIHISYNLVPMMNLITYDDIETEMALKFIKEGKGEKTFHLPQKHYNKPIPKNLNENLMVSTLI